MLIIFEFLKVNKMFKKESWSGNFNIRKLDFRTGIFLGKREKLCNNRRLSSPRIFITKMIKVHP